MGCFAAGSGVGDFECVGECMVWVGEIVLERVFDLGVGDLIVQEMLSTLLRAALSEGSKVS